MRLLSKIREVRIDDRIPRNEPDYFLEGKTVSMQLTQTKLHAIIAENYLSISVEDLPTNQPLLSTGLIDSFSLVDLALEIEREFGVRIDDTELHPDVFDTLEELTALINTRL